MTAAVDVVIAARNEARLIGDCLAALAAQDVAAALDVIVADDGSTDGTAEIARRHGARVVTLPGRGAAAARNAGLRAGGAALVAFLDAHSLAAPDWIDRMAAALDDPLVGGCQSWIENRSVDPRVQRYLDASGALANPRVLADSVHGDRNLYPWMPTSACMYRRAALEAVDGFNEAMLACEDVELAWRVVLRGYRLAYVPAARVTHYDCNPWRRFVTKGVGYGRGAAQLAALFRPHGASAVLSADRLWQRRPEALLASLHYRFGFAMQRWRQRLGRGPRLTPIGLGAADEALRPWASWRPAEQLRISQAAIYWYRDEPACSVVVHPASRSRYVLDGTADLIWRRLAAGHSRDDVVAEIVARFAVAPVTAAADLDELVESLAAAGVVEQRSLPVRGEGRDEGRSEGATGQQETGNDQ